MGPLTIIWAVVLFFLVLWIGVIAHELSHAVVLRAIGASYELQFFPSDQGLTDLGVLVPIATVTPKSVPVGRDWGVRFSAIAPLGLALPMALVIVGAVPDPTQSGNITWIVMTIAWLGCGIPSPQDFAVFWNPKRVRGDTG